MRHVAIYQIFSSRISAVYRRPRGDISTHIGPKRYPIKFYTYHIVLAKILISRPIYQCIGRYLKQCEWFTLIRSAWYEATVIDFWVQPQSESEVICSLQQTERSGSFKTQGRVFSNHRRMIRDVKIFRKS